jgi:hypothetical protein
MRSSVTKAIVYACFSLAYLQGVVPAAHAVEVGDVIRLSSNGIGLTVTETHRVNRETVVMTAQQLESNASEFCERYEQLSPESQKWKSCVKEGISDKPTIVTVNCRTHTILLGGGTLGDGSYRPSETGGPWNSVANPDWIIQGDEVYKSACHR